MKLWVDDLRDAPDDTWTVARKVQSAILFLEQFQPDEISLDHDIENRPSDETFLPLAYYMGLKYYGLQDMSDFKTGFGPRVQAIPIVTIHSINPVGALEMQNVLAYYKIKSKIKPYARS